jgi:hypothetical protein
MANAWIEYIKKISKETGKSFKEAMSIASDRKKKGIKIESIITPLVSPAKKQRKTRKGKSGKKAKGTKKRRGSSKRR